MSVRITTFRYFVSRMRELSLILHVRSSHQTLWAKCTNPECQKDRELIEQAEAELRREKTR